MHVIMKLLLAACLLLAVVEAFGNSIVTSSRARGKGLSSMEYIPDGMSKAQWAALKKKEADDMEALKKKGTLGAVGITKFKSRSFEAWQKSGQKNLFPVSPDTPEELKPYMQRKGGMADGSDLLKKGKMGMGQGAFQKRLDVDDRYDKLEKAGKLKSSPFSLPWSNEAAQKYKPGEEKAKAAKEAAAAKLASAAKKPATIRGKKVVPEPEPVVVDPPRKKLFGLF